MTAGKSAVAALAAVLCTAPRVAADTASEARRYRTLTTHTPESVQADRHRLDWANKPEPYRLYPGAETLPLLPPRRLAAPAIDAIAHAGGASAAASSALDLGGLGTILFLTGGIIGTRPASGGDIRASAAAGALYPNELYVVTGALPDLAAGVYHYDPKRERLTRLRDGDWRAALAAAAADDRIGRAPTTLVLTGILWRSAWKYRERAYRHLLWDGGMMLAHTLAAAHASEVAATVLGLFVDGEVDAIVGIDGRHEQSLALVMLGSGGAPTAAQDETRAPVPPLAFHPTPLSVRPIDYPGALRYHAAAALRDAATVRDFRNRPAPVPRYDDCTQRPEPLPAPASARGDPSLDAVVRRRRSTRRFANLPISTADLAAVLQLPTRGAAADFLHGEGTLLETYVIVHAVTGIPPGAYHYRRQSHALELVEPGDFRQTAAFLSLRQALARDASAVVYYLSNLDAVGETFGDRGYRMAELEAGLVAGRAYLAAHAIGRGATGLTFFDEEVRRFFSPHAAALEPLLVVAVGIPRKRP
jgi:SagB-type dehydrogenase family enzyme